MVWKRGSGSDTSAKPAVCRCPITKQTRRSIIRARQKLNYVYFLGSVLLAYLAGRLTGSWIVLLGALAILIAINLNNGAIRPTEISKMPGIG